MIYLDHAAGSPLEPVAREAWLSAHEAAGNPSSIHGAGQQARAVLDEARGRIAAALAVDGIEVTLTGGGTEAVNLGIKGMFWHRRAADPAKRRIIVPRAEHHATLDAVHWLVDHEGAEAAWVDVDDLGRLLIEGAGGLREALGDGHDVALVTMLAANNEVGTLQPVAEASALAAAVEVPVHVDAIAAFGQVPLERWAGAASLPEGIAAVSISAHKLGGPVGVGALVLRRGFDAVPLLHGGTQQRARSGTMDVAGAAAFAAVVELAEQRLRDPGGSAGKREVRERLAEGIRQRVPQAVLRGAAGERWMLDSGASTEARRAELDALALPGTLHMTVPGAEGDSLLMLLDHAGFAVSTGSACQAGVPEASHVLLAMGLSDEDARGALRMSLGASTTIADVDALLEALPAAVERAQAAGLAARTPRLGR